MDMKFYKINLFIILFLKYQCFCFKLEFLNYKHTKHAVLFACNSFNDFNLLKEMFDYGIRTTVAYDTSINNLKPLSGNYSKIAIFVNTSCSGWEEVLKSTERKHFKHPYNWLFYTKNVSKTTVVLSKYHIELDSDLLLLYERNNSLDIFEVYNTGFHNRGEFITTPVGLWNAPQLFLSPRSRTNLTGVVLKCMIVVRETLRNETLNQFLRHPRVEQDVLHHLKYYTLLTYLKDMYDFTYDILRTNTWGYLTNGSFDGMIGALQRREIDIGGSPIFFKSERFKVHDYSIQTWNSKQIFLFRHPKRQGSFYTIFTRPLSTNVWYCIITTLTISAVLLCAMLKFKPLRQDGDEEDSSWSIAVLSIWSAICQQGSTVSRSSISIKLVLFITFIFSLTIYQYYNATVVSTLLREPPKYIKTLEDLAESDIKIGIEDIVFNKDYFRYTTNPTAQKLYKEKIATDTQYNFFNPAQGMAMVKRGGFAFHVNSPTGYKIMRQTFTEREVCDVQEVTLFPPISVVSAIQKGSPYKEAFSYGLRKMHESGVMQRILTVWDEPRTLCVLRPENNNISVSIVEFSMALLILAIGNVLAIIILICECIMYNMEKRQKKKGSQRKSKIVVPVLSNRWR